MIILILTCVILMAIIINTMTIPIFNNINIIIINY